MFVHDVCDAPLELAKLARYADREALANGIFAAFTLIWFAMRVFYFPIVIIRSALTDAHAAFLGDRYYTRFPHWESFCGLLIVLWVLHMYWSYVILRILRSALSSGSAKDDREDDE